MGIELDLLNAIQTIHTPALDNIMCGITRLGNGGVFWLSLRTGGTFMQWTVKAFVLPCPPM